MIVSALLSPVLETQSGENAKREEPKETVVETQSVRVEEEEQAAKGSEEKKEEDTGVIEVKNEPQVVGGQNDGQHKHQEEVAPVINEHNEEAVQSEVVSSEVSEPVRNGEVQSSSGRGVETEGEREEEKEGEGEEKTAVTDEQVGEREGGREEGGREQGRRKEVREGESNSVPYTFNCCRLLPILLLT